MLQLIRKLVPPVFILVIFCLTVTAAAQVATGAVVNIEYVTKAELYVTLASVLITVLGGCAGVLAFILSRERDVQQEQFNQLTKVVTEVGVAVKELVKVISDHDRDPYAHAEASEHNHGPMIEDLKEIKETVLKLSTEHDIMRKDEDNVCALIKRSALMRVSDTLTKRATDPEDFDPEELRK